MNAKQNTPTAETGMLIRKPIDQTFEAFVDPKITTKFWFTKSTGRREKDKNVEWTLEMYNVISYVLVKDLMPKAYLEFNIQLNLVADRFPKGK
jgi:uncharacterized protein YndB with AHSA1/START domain